MIKSVKGPNDSDLKIFDMQYYENEIDLFESFLEGTLMLGTIKIVREFVKCKDRVQNEGGDQFCYLTTMRDTRYKDNEIHASIGLVHGFAQNQNIAFFESGLAHAMNGFDVTLIDMKGFGLSSGTRRGGVLLQDSGEQIGLMLQKMRKDKPAFIIGHSMGCMNTQNFLINNPSINVAGTIYTAPFFEFAKEQKVSFDRKILGRILKLLGEEVIILSTLETTFLAKCKLFWRNSMSVVNGTTHPLLSGQSFCSMVDGIHDVQDNQHKTTIPYLLLIAGRDKIVDNAGANRFFNTK